MKKLFIRITTAALLSLAVSAAAPAAVISVYAAPVLEDGAGELCSPCSIEQAEEFPDVSGGTDCGMPGLFPYKNSDDSIERRAYCQEEHPDGQGSGCIGTGTVEYGLFACLG